MASASINLSGVVYRRQGDGSFAVPGAVIRATNEIAQISCETETDDEGRFVFDQLVSGNWELSAQKSGFKPMPPLQGEFYQDNDNLHMEMQPGVTVTGVIYRHGSTDRIGDAIVLARKGDVLMHTATDENGGFGFDSLEPGQWSFRVLHEGSHTTEPRELLLEADRRDLTFDLLRSMSTPDADAGMRFFYSLMIAFVALIAVYIYLHISYPQTPKPMSTALVTLLGQAQAQLQSADPTAIGSELAVTLDDIKASLDNALADQEGLSRSDRISFMDIVTNLELSAQENNKAAVLARLTNLQRLVESPPAAAFAFWNREPWRFIEVLFWALAGVLVNMIIMSGSFLRWKRFYREGIIMHISHLATIPVLVLVAALLLSLISMKITLPGGSGVELDLSNTSILVAFAFLLGARPWTIWSFIQEYAGRDNGREQEGATS
ncbi:MAG: carboxypeptidase-like regulatory domain-containing protein [Gammaproteobacteria bacterium]